MAQILPLIESLGPWVRGPATISKGRVRLDFTRRVRYYPMASPNLPYALARVRTEQDVVPFVEHFGLLRHGDVEAESEFVEGTPDDHIPRVVHETVESLLVASRATAELIRVMVDLERASRADTEAPAAVDRLAKWAAGNWPDHMQRKRTSRRSADLEFLRDVELFVAARLTEDLAGLRLGVVGGAMSRLDLGVFRFGAHEARTLLNFSAFHLALQLTNKTPIRECLQCGEFFPIHDARQRFCGDACATRSRVMRHRQRTTGSAK